MMQVVSLVEFYRVQSATALEILETQGPAVVAQTNN